MIQNKTCITESKNQNSHEEFKTVMRTRRRGELFLPSFHGFEQAGQIFGFCRRRGPEASRRRVKSEWDLSIIMIPEEDLAAVFRGHRYRLGPLTVHSEAGTRVRVWLTTKSSLRVLAVGAGAG